MIDTVVGVGNFVSEIDFEKINSLIADMLGIAPDEKYIDDDPVTLFYFIKPGVVAKGIDYLKNAINDFWGEDNKGKEKVEDNRRKQLIAEYSFTVGGWSDNINFNIYNDGTIECILDGGKDDKKLLCSMDKEGCTKFYDRTITNDSIHWVRDLCRKFIKIVKSKVNKKLLNLEASELQEKGVTDPDEEANLAKIISVSYALINKIVIEQKTVKDSGFMTNLFGDGKREIYKITFDKQPKIKMGNEKKKEEKKGDGEERKDNDENESKNKNNEKEEDEVEDKNNDIGGDEDEYKYKKENEKKDNNEDENNKNNKKGEKEKKNKEEEENEEEKEDDVEDENDKKEENKKDNDEDKDKNKKIDDDKEKKDKEGEEEEEENEEEKEDNEEEKEDSVEKESKNDKKNDKKGGKNEDEESRYNLLDNDDEENEKEKGGGILNPNDKNHELSDDLEQAVKDYTFMTAVGSNELRRQRKDDSEKTYNNNEYREYFESIIGDNNGNNDQMKKINGTYKKVFRQEMNTNEAMKGFETVDIIDKLFTFRKRTNSNIQQKNETNLTTSDFVNKVNKMRREITTLKERTDEYNKKKKKLELLCKTMNESSDGLTGRFNENMNAIRNDTSRKGELILLQVKMKALEIIQRFIEKVKGEARGVKKEVNNDDDSNINKSINNDDKNNKENSIETLEEIRSKVDRARKEIINSNKIDSSPKKKDNISIDDYSSIN